MSSGIDYYTGPFDTYSNDLGYCAISGRRRRAILPELGTRWGELTVRGYARGERGGVTGVVVECSCQPGLYLVSESNLKRGKSTRCDKCAKVKSIKTRKKYLGYADIVADDKVRPRLLDRISAVYMRCENPNDKGYRHYGGRGIRVYPPWCVGLGDGRWSRDTSGKRAFLEYLTTLPGWDQQELELDREDNNKGYEPGNLRFITRKANMENRRTVGRLQERIDELESRLRSCQCGAAQSIYSSNG